MNQPLKSVTMPSGLFSKASIYLALLLACLGFFVATSSWLYHQLAQRADYLQQQQIPFIKNNALLLNKLTELEYYLSQQRLNIQQQQFDQPIEQLRESWLDIISLTQEHMQWLNDQVRLDQAGEVQEQAQQFVDEYRQFTELVDDLLLLRQARNGQYRANMQSLEQLIARVVALRNQKQLVLDKQSTAFVSVQNRVNTQLINEQVIAVNEVEYYQYLYQELLLLNQQMTLLTSSLEQSNFNDVAANVAIHARRITEHLPDAPDDKNFAVIREDTETLINQFIGSGQLFAKWRDEAQVSKLVVKRLSLYQGFLKQTGELVSSSQFFHLPEFVLTIPVIGISVSESMMLPVGFLAMVILMTFSALIAWRMLVLVSRSFYKGAEHGYELAKQGITTSVTSDVGLDTKRVAELMNTEAKPEIIANELALIEAQALEDANALQGQPGPDSIAESSPVCNADLTQARTTGQLADQVIMDMEKFNHYHATSQMALTMLDDYMQRNQQNLQRLHAAFGSENLALVAKINEAILQTAKILFAPRLIRVCQIMRQYCHEQEFDDAKSLLPAVEQAMGEIKEHAQQCC
ncbi:hypothetical protein [Thalassotalea mangrovi]|uniref:Uncharacterized protein n=1 Tax=Thalassotalea mangrovi TaxID=2572245 RepID=A0A4U1B853_9GAMM|nr:hypothetical protein [Thalassotalea mangrovi]TKB46689.1 hypothetical protein E8M12_03805 [Thalassotalea mangrovi]